MQLAVERAAISRATISKIEKSEIEVEFYLFKNRHMLDKSYLLPLSDQCPL